MFADERLASGNYVTPPNATEYPTGLKLYVFPRLTFYKHHLAGPPDGGFGLGSSGQVRNISRSLSNGAVMRPTTVSNGGLLGALGWLRVGVNDFIVSNCSASLLDLDGTSASSNFGRSCSSSSLICILRSCISDSKVGMKSRSSGVMFWNLYSCSLV